MSNDFKLCNESWYKKMIDLKRLDQYNMMDYVMRKLVH